MVQNTKLKAILAELRGGLEAIYGPRLKGLFLFGSYARGEQEKYSDIDVLIVLNQITHYAGEVDRTGYLTSELCLKHNVAVSRVFVTEQDWKTRDTSFLANVREDAIAA